MRHNLCQKISITACSDDKNDGDSVNKSEWSEMCLFEVERHTSEDVNLEVNFWLFKNIGEEKIGENQ